LSIPLERSISTFLMFFSTLYITILSSILSAFRCFPQDDGSLWLLVRHWIATILCGLQIYGSSCWEFCWFSPFPYACIWFCIKIAIIFSRNLFFWKFGSLYDRYKPQFYYWEV
jgi:hypothetical protein